MILACIPRSRSRSIPSKSWTIKPDLVALTSMTTSYHYVEQLVERLKDALGVPIIIGGPHATTLPEGTLNNPNIDYLVYGEGEYIWQDFLRALAAGDTQWGQIQGLWYKEDGKIMSGGSRKPIEDLDSLPFPARHLFELDKYPLYAPNGEPMLTVLSSRGCPYACSFCFKGIVGRSYHQRSPEDIVAELKQVVDTYHIRNFYFIDDLFTIDVKRLEKILDYFIDQKLDYRWRCLARVDRVTPELLTKMYKAGCRQIHYGIESGNEEVLRRTSKHIDLKQVRDAVAWTEHAGIRSKGYFILGLPGDTEETMQETIEFAAGLELTEAMFSIATPFPGTKLWNDLVAQEPWHGVQLRLHQELLLQQLYRRNRAVHERLRGERRCVERHGFDRSRALPGSQRAAQVCQVLWPGLGQADVSGVTGQAGQRRGQGHAQQRPVPEIPSTAAARGRGVVGVR